MSPLLCLAFMIASPQAAAANPEDAKLVAFFDRYLDATFRMHPTAATAAGDHRFDAQMDDVSPAARDADLAFTMKTLSELSTTFDSVKLSRAGQIDFEIFKHSLTMSLWQAQNTKPYEEDPRVYNELISSSVYLLFTQSTLPKEQNVKNAAGRIAGIPAVVAAAKASLKNPPKQLVETALKQNRGSIAFYESGLFTVAGESPQFSPMAGPAKAAVAALKQYQEFLEKDLLPRATGEWRIGKEKFAAKLKLELDAGIDAADVLAEATAEAQRVTTEMAAISRQLWPKLFPGQVAPALDERGTPAPIIRQVLAKLADDHGTGDTIVADAKATVDVIKKFITAKDILRLPDPDRCQVVEMPEFQRGNSAAYLNPAPPLDPKANSVYAVSPPPKDWDARTAESFFREYNRSMLQILTIHEAYPGHYVQLEYSNRHPSKIRKLLYSGTFAEGWAVYTEQVMLDQGYGDGDLSLRLHQLKFYLRAVINSILDHLMHCTAISDSEALDLLVNRGFQSDGEAIAKVVRAKQSSCQLSTYFVGRTAFHRLRQAVQREQGDKFDLGRFHEAVLDHGTLPVKYLPELVRERLKQPR